jgi:uncharacterized OB-fold protein
MSIRPANAARRDEASAHWFDGLADGVLLIRRCPRCGLHSRPDTATCPACHAEGLEWVPAAGRGTVVCVIVEHREQDEVALGLVELDEGPWLAARITDRARATPGARVELVVVTPDEGEPFPAFAPIG